MSNKIFPIKVEPACLLKWAWSTVRLNSSTGTGTSSSCHRTHGWPIDPNNFENFHNLPEKLRDRQAMLDGQWPGYGCEYCKYIEEAGGLSDRVHQLRSQVDICTHPPELNENPTATHVTPTILEVFFKNTCNMACTYCHAGHSSRWEDEDRRFLGKSTVSLSDTTVNFNQYKKMVNDLWIYLDTNKRYDILRRFHILGGEPFLLSELDDSIEFWYNHPNINLLFSIITNLNIPTSRLQTYIDKFEKLILENKIWKLQITASLDSWGPSQEFVRYGLDLDLWRKNFELLVSIPWITLSINSTMSSLTIKDMPELIKKINYWNSLRGPMEQTIDHVFNEPIIHSFETVITNPDNLYIFGPNIFDEDLDKVVKLMPTETSEQKSSKEQMQSIANALKHSNKDDEKIEQFKNYLDVLDHRRGTNWRNLFPWLACI
jgi:hypothetical protein